jgi:hypothetical protein
MCGEKFPEVSDSDFLFNKLNNRDVFKVGLDARRLDGVYMLKEVEAEGATNDVVEFTLVKVKKVVE